MILRKIASVGIMALISISALADDQAGSAPTHQQKTTAQTPIHQRNCEAGKGDACYQIAFRHVMGSGGLAKDFAAAAAFYQRACDLGYVDGCTSLGKAHEIGEGVPIDITRAAQLYEKACEKGSSSACLYMGDAYAAGTGVALDAGLAIAYFRKACVADKASLVCGYANDHMAMMQSPVAYQAGRCDSGEGDDCVSLPAVDPVEVADSAQDQALVARPSFASFGAYAGLNGRAYVGSDGTYVLWYMSPSGTTMVSETRLANGALDNIHVIKPTTQGTLLMLRSGYCPDEVCGQTGTVTDGVVTWREPKASGGRSGLMMEVRMWLEEDGNVLVTQTTNPNPAGGGPPNVLAPYELKLVDPPQRSGEIVAQSKGLVANLESRVDVDVAQSLGKQLAIRQAQDDAMEARRRSSERVQSFNRLMGSVNSALAEVDTGGYAEAQANLDATVANIQHAAAAERRAQATAQQQTTTRAVDYRAEVAEQATQLQPSQSATAPVEPTAHAEPAAAKPLRFVMQISLNNRPGDKVNPTCYSNIISRPGPPGWGAPGSLPPGSAEQAREAVYSLKSTFIAQCRASGREITSDGNFNFQLNQSQGDEERLRGMRARYNEDVSVSL